MKAVILYDSKTSGGSTEAIIDTIGLKLAESGAYVEKVKCKALADYSFIKEFDLVILGAPVYYFLVASQLLGALNYGNLKINLKRKKIAMFLTCGSSEAMAAVLYLHAIFQRGFNPGAFCIRDHIFQFCKGIRLGHAARKVNYPRHPTRVIGVEILQNFCLIR